MTKKIMFSDKYGLTDAVLNGNKTQTRRIGKDDIFSIYLKQKEYSLVIMNDKVLVRDNAVLLILIRLTKRLKRKPTYFSRWMNFDNIIWWFKIKVIYLPNE